MCCSTSPVQNHPLSLWWRVWIIVLLLVWIRSEFLRSHDTSFIATRNFCHFDGFCTNSNPTFFYKIFTLRIINPLLWGCRCCSLQFLFSRTFQSESILFSHFLVSTCLTNVSLVFILINLFYQVNKCLICSLKLKFWTFLSSSPSWFLFEQHQY